MERHAARSHVHGTTVQETVHTHPTTHNTASHSTALWALPHSACVASIELGVEEHGDPVVRDRLIREILEELRLVLRRRRTKNEADEQVLTARRARHMAMQQTICLLPRRWQPQQLLRLKHPQRIILPVTRRMKEAVRDPARVEQLAAAEPLLIKVFDLLVPIDRHRCDQQRQVLLL